MATTLSTKGRNASCNAIVDLLDGGTLEIQTSGAVEVATLGFGTPAFGAAATGEATANAISDDESATGGTAALCQLKDSVGDAILSGTVTATGGGGDIELSTVTIGAGAIVSITSLTVTVPAS